MATASDATEVGGWATILGKSPTDPLTADDVRRIGAYVGEKLRTDPVIAFMLINPLTNVLAQSQIADTRRAIAAALTPLVGTPIGSIPNDLGKLEAVRSGVPGFTGDLLYGNNWVTDLVGGLGNVGAHVGLLGGIVVIGLLGLWMMVAPGVGAYRRLKAPRMRLV